MADENTNTGAVNEGADVNIDELKKQYATAQAEIERLKEEKSGSDRSVSKLQKQMAEIQAEIENERKAHMTEAERIELEKAEALKQTEAAKAEALKYRVNLAADVELGKAGIPLDFAPFVLAGDEDGTKANVSKLSELLKARDESMKAEIVKSGASTPPAAGKPKGIDYDAEIAKLQKDTSIPANERGLKIAQLLREKAENS